MANGTYKLLKQDASGNWTETDVLAVSGKILGFDASLNPVTMDYLMANPTFHTTYTSVDITSGSLGVFNQTQRFYYIFNTNFSASSITLSISRNMSSPSSYPTLQFEHYVLIKNNAATTKTVVIQGAVSGSKIIMADASGIALAAGKLLEIGYYWTMRGSDYICVITRSNILTETTTT